jgi:putative ABC transport system ATP-binding protein
MTATATALRGVAVSAHGLVHIYRMEGNDVVALTSVDLDVLPGQLVALLGPSGAGKSTLLRLLAGLQIPSAGRLHVGDHDLAAINAGELDRMRAYEVGIVLQGAANNLLPYLTPEGNIAFAQRAARRYRNSTVPDPREVLELVGLADQAQRPLRSLTPGQQQRLAVGVAMATLPGLLLADEPTSQLDHAYRDEILDAIVHINGELGTTVIAVTHDPQVAERFSRTITIRDGRIGAEGRAGKEYAVVGRDGSLQLPPHVRDIVAPGTLLEVWVDDGGTIRLDRMQAETDSNEVRR